MTREKFATQVNFKILKIVRRIAEKTTPRPHVMGAYLASHEKYGPLYKAR